MIKDVAYSPQDAEGAAAAGWTVEHERLVALSQDLLGILGDDGRVRWMNSAIETIGGWSAGELIGKPMLTFVHPEDLASTLEAFVDVLSGGPAREFECRCQRKDGSYRWLAWSARRDQVKQLVYVVGRDVTERKRTDEALLESEERYRRLVELAPDAIAVYSAGRLVFVNAACAKLLGAKSPTEVVGRPIGDFLPPDSKPMARNRARQLLTDGKPALQFEQQLIRLDGTAIDLELAVAMTTHKGTRAVQVIGRDITGRRREAAQLVRISKAVESASDAIALADQDGVSIYHNKAFLDLFGYTPAELHAAGGPAAAYESQQVADEVFSNIKAGRPWSGEITMRMRSGRLVPIDLRADAIKDESGRIVGLIGIHTDIGERQQAARALRESEARYRSLYGAIEAGIVVHGPEGWIVDVNQRTEEMLGYSVDQLRGSNSKRRVIVFHEDGTPVPYHQFPAMVALRTGQRVHNVVHKIRLASGELGTFLVNAAPTVDPSSGAIIGAVATLLDITEHKRTEEALRAALEESRNLEEQLVRAQRLEAAGRIAGQVAHDFNNLLAPLAGYPELIKMDLPPGHGAAQLCDAMLEAVERMAVINKDLMTLSRRGYQHQEPTDLNRLVDQAVEQLWQRPGTIKIQLDLAEDLLPISASAAQLSRVITNLLFNGYEAMQDVGTLAVKTANRYVDLPLNGYNRVPVGEYVVLEVRDTGCGIPPEIRDRIFDAFFTTKRSTERRGCGLGLSVVQAIVDDHRGYVDFESAVGRGTTFRIYLPICREAPTERRNGELPRGNEHVLIVDDDEGQRTVASQLLQSLGYQVHAVATGEEAVAYLRRQDADLVVLDMIMPGLNGAETYRLALKVRPRQRAIIVSGFADSEHVREAQSLGAGAFVAKPVTLSTLARAVRVELERASQS